MSKVGTLTVTARPLRGIVTIANGCSITIDGGRSVRCRIYISSLFRHSQLWNIKTICGHVAEEGHWVYFRVNCQKVTGTTQDCCHMTS